MIVRNDSPDPVDPVIDGTTVKHFVATQIAVIAPLAAVVLCPPAAIPLAAVGFGVLKSVFGRPIK